jgi:hypothetical protein
MYQVCGAVFRKLTTANMASIVSLQVGIIWAFGNRKP